MLQIFFFWPLKPIFSMLSLKIKISMLNYIGECVKSLLFTYFMKCFHFSINSDYLTDYKKIFSFLVIQFHLLIGIVILLKKCKSHTAIFLVLNAEYLACIPLSQEKFKFELTALKNLYDICDSSTKNWQRTHDH
jgi:hypothetical protein